MIKKILKWATALGVGIWAVLHLPQLAVALMVVPIVAVTQDPYAGAVLAVLASILGMYAVVYVGEIAAFMAARGIVHLINRWQTRIAIRRVLA